MLAKQPDPVHAVLLDRIITSPVLVDGTLYDWLVLRVHVTQILVSTDSELDGEAALEVVDESTSESASEH